MSSDAIVRQIPNEYPDPRLKQVLFGALFLGVVALSSLPAARGASAWFGSMPLWLLGMPLTALAALSLRHRLRTAGPASPMRASRRRRADTNLQARRRNPATAPSRIPHAA